MIIWFAASVYILIFFPCCMLGPKHTVPCVPVPNSFSEKNNASLNANLTSWWTHFQDPYFTDLIEKSVKNNYDLRIALEKIEQTRAEYNIQGAYLYPEIDAIASVNRNGYSRNLKRNTGLPNAASYFALGFDALWEMDLWGKLRHAKASAKALWQAQQEHMRDVYITLLGDVAKTYVEIRSLQKQVNILTQQIDIDKRLLVLINERFKSGIDSQIPVTDQQIILADTQNQLITLQINLKQAINRLAVLLGQNPEQFCLMSGSNNVPTSKISLGIGLPSELLRRRPDIRRAERLLASATEDVGHALASWFPSFSLLGGVLYEGNSSSNVFSRKSLSWTIGPSMSWPIMSFGRIEFAIDEKKSIRRQAILTYAKTVVTAFSEVENALIAYFNALDQVKVLHDKLVSSKKRSDLTQSLFACGLDNELDSLSAEKNRFVTELELTNAQQLQSTALIALYKSLGGGW